MRLYAVSVSMITRKGANVKANAFIASFAPLLLAIVDCVGG